MFIGNTALTNLTFEPITLIPIMTNEALNKYSQKIVHFLPIMIFVCALFIVHNQLKDQDLDNIISTLRTTPMWIVSVAFVLTLLNYLILAAYDGLALYFTGHTKIPLPKVIAAALLSYAISNNTGHAWAAGGSIRYRFYAKWGVPGLDILKISLFLAITYLLGALSLGLVGSLLLPHYSSNAVQEPEAIYWTSVICGATLLGYWGAVWCWRKPVTIKGFELYLPSLTMTVWQTVVSSIDIILSSIVLWVLLLGKVDISFSGFVMVFVVAQVAGVISQIPGGIGVFEGTFLWLMSDIQGTDQHLVLIGALMLFRAIYFFIPLFLAGVGLLGYELFNRPMQSVESKSNLGRLTTAIMPKLYSFLLLFVGGILVVSGFIHDSEALNSLRDLLFLSMAGMSPSVSILFGLLLLFLARGIRLKIDAAWYSNLFLLAWGIIVSLLNESNWDRVLVLSMMLMLLLSARRRFRRPSSLLQMSFSKYWLATNAMVLAGSVWLGFCGYPDVETTPELSWFDSPEDNTPNPLWDLLTIAVIPLCYGLWRLLSVAPPKFLNKPSASELEEAQRLLVQSPHTQGFLALLGDKYLFWNSERSAFIMFEVTSKFWVAVSDPIGKPSAFKSLLRQYQEQADRHGAKAVFYKVNAELLPHYLDLGLSLYKLGEEARVSLPSFSLQGKQHDAQRSRRNKFSKMGYQFEILSGQAVDAALPCLRRISDAWVSNKHAREKGFSLGFFDEAYLRHTDVAVIKDDVGKIMAFANLWQTANREELSIDLMRYDPATQRGIMDFLFAELMLWGKAENYQWFSLGLAPLAGLERCSLAPVWHKIGAALFDMGDQFYNFKGLHEYKAKYTPHWEPRYLAAPGGVSLPFILIIITCLISGGWQGIFSKLPQLRKPLFDNLLPKDAIKRLSL
jgi:phosphatidylglycerol lysyltransferase